MLNQGSFVHSSTVDGSKQSHWRGNGIVSEQKSPLVSRCKETVSDRQRTQE